MARRVRTELEEPDDIELLNVHRYPESVSPALLAYVRNSKNCQHRLQELLKTVPNRRQGRFSREAAIAGGEPEAADATALPIETAWTKVKRYLLG